MVTVSSAHSGSEWNPGKPDNQEYNGEAALSGGGMRDARAKNEPRGSQLGDIAIKAKG